MRLFQPGFVSGGRALICAGDASRPKIEALSLASGGQQLLHFADELAQVDGLG
jgi:hypothetical protein